MIWYLYPSMLNTVLTPLIHYSDTWYYIITVGPKQWNEWGNPIQPVKNTDSMCIDLRHVNTGTMLWMWRHFCWAISVMDGLLCTYFLINVGLAPSTYNALHWSHLCLCSCVLVYSSMSLYTRQTPGISFSSSCTTKCFVDAIVMIPKTHAHGPMLCPTSGDFTTLRN